MKILSLTSRNSLAVAVLSASISAPTLANPAYVTNGDDWGAGSLRAALESGANQIVVTTNKKILITSTLVYGGTKPLSIYGNGAKVKTWENITLLEISEGADLRIEGMKFEGPGGWNIENRGDEGEDAGKGIFIDVRDDQTGTVDLVLRDVKVSGVANHGVHVSDCSLADACGGGSGGDGEGSPASISVTFDDVTIDDVGNGKFDADGLRVDERDRGSIRFDSYRSKFTNVGADGVELDEGQNGSVIAHINDNKFNDNGNYCDPAVLEAYLPEPDEAEYEDGEVLPDEIPGGIEGSPDDSCFEREVDLYDSGFVEAYKFGLDLDDGIDLDEAGAGDIESIMIGSRIEGNLDEGVDYDEEDNGGITALYIDTKAEMSNDDGFKHSEEGNGSVIGLVLGSKSVNNGGKGIVYEEEGKGSLTVDVIDSRTRENDDSDDTGIEVVQEDQGSGLLTVTDSKIEDGIDADGVTVVEN